MSLLAIALVVGQGSVARAASTPTQTIHLLVRFEAGTTDAERASATSDLGGTIEGEIRALGVTRIAVTVERGADPAALLRAAAARPKVASVEEDARVHTSWTPNDPYWNTDPYVGLGQWGDRKILLDRALDVVGALSLAPVTVAVIDTGVDAGHPDLAGVVLPGTTILSSQNAACNADAVGTDDNSHGTHVAGIIAADANNGIGIAGVASNARILPIKALDCTGSGLTSDVSQAITFAVDRGARLVNVSLGSSSGSDTLLAAVNYAVAHNVLIVAAAGNCGNASRLPAACLQTQNRIEYPAAYPGVLAVGATATDDSIAPFSTQGSQVGVSAPGVNIISTTPRYSTYQSARGATTSYAVFSGTSQATPFVTGTAALVLGIDPTLTGTQLTDRLKQTADDLGPPGPDPAFGAGRINALRAATATVPSFGARYDTSLVPRSATSGATFTAKVAVTNTSPVAWPASGATPVHLSYHWLDANANVVVWDGVRTPLPSDLQPGAAVTLNMSVLAPPTRGAYILRVDLVREGLAWFSQKGVAPGDVPVAVGSGLGASYATAAATAAFFTAAPAALGVTVTNTGTSTWPAAGTSPVRLAYHWLRPDGSVAVWDGARAPAFASDVAPGATVTVQLPVAAPPDLGPYTLRLDLVQEGVTWFSDQGVAPRDIGYVVTTGYSASYAPPAAAATLLPGERTSITVGLKNDGVVAWAAAGANPVHLAAHLADAAGNVVLWDGVRTAFAADVAPGTSVLYAVAVDAPLAAGAYRARVDLVREGIAWFSTIGIAPADVPFSVASDYRAQIVTPSAIMVSRSAPALQVTIANVTPVLWTAGGPAPVDVAAHWYDAAGNVLAWDGPRTPLGRDVGPGQSVTLNVALGTPPAGAFAVTVDLVSEGVRWFGAGQRSTVTLLP